MLALYAVDRRRPVARPRAGALLDVVLAHFADGDGGFFDTADDAEALLRRPQDPTDNATPSGSVGARRARCSPTPRYTGSSRHREAAEAALGGLRAAGAAHPRFAGWGLAVAEALVDGPREVAVVGAAGDDAG